VIKRGTVHTAGKPTVRSADATLPLSTTLPPDHSSYAYARNDGRMDGQTDCRPDDEAPFVQKEGEEGKKSKSKNNCNPSEFELAREKRIPY